MEKPFRPAGFSLNETARVSRRRRIYSARLSVFRRSYSGGLSSHPRQASEALTNYAHPYTLSIMRSTYRASKNRQCFRAISLAITLLYICPSMWSAPILGKHGAVATVNPYATDAAIDAFKKGGNAVDATVGAARTLGGVDGQNSGIGGGCFLLIRTERGTVIAIDGRETAPAAATRDMFLRNGKADPDLSQTGALAIGVPGSLAAYDYALRHFGKLKLNDLLLSAAELAENGFIVDSHYAARLKETASDLRKFEAARKIFLK